MSPRVFWLAALLVIIVFWTAVLCGPEFMRDFWLALYDWLVSSHNF